MSTIKYLFLLLLFNSSQTVTAQVFGTIPAKTADSKSFFLYEVKLIDEFMERFNDDPGSYIREQCRSLYGTDSMITRGKLLRTLINKNQSWATDTAQFFQQVTDLRHPEYLSFTDSNWYAEAKCIFLYNKNKIEIPLVLRIKTVNGGSKWMIAGIGSSAIFKDKPVLPSVHKDIQATSGDFIPTSSHGTNFMVFNYVFSEKMHAADYFEKELLATSKAQYFIQLIKQHTITFRYVKNIRYHFFRVENWVFTVEQFKRKEANTGWLMSGLQKVSMEEKEALLKIC